MTEPASVEDSIKHSIRKNGYPEKAVRLPFKPVYEACKNQGTSLSEVLDRLRKENIEGAIVGNHVEFRSPDNKPVVKENGEEKAGGIPWLKDLPDLGSLKETAMNYLGQLTPEQMTQIRQKVESMSDEEKKNIIKMFSQKNDPQP